MAQRKTPPEGGRKRRSGLTPAEQAEAVSDWLCIFGAVSVTAGVGLLLGVGALLITAGVCCIGLAWLISRGGGAA